MLSILFFTDNWELIFHSRSEAEAQKVALQKLHELRAIKSSRAEKLFVVTCYRTTEYLEKNLLTSEKSRHEWWVYSQYKEASRVQGYEVHKLNPQDLDASIIPPGTYCYFGRESTTIDKETGMPSFKMKMCPYFTHMTFNGVNVPWCSFLNKGGTEGSLKHGQTEAEAEVEWQKLKDYFVTEENMNKVLPLDLLWDSCKECGIDDFYEEENL